MTLIKHEMKMGKSSLIVWTLAISAMLSICVFIYPQMKSQMADISKMFSDMGSFSSAFGMDKLNFGDFMGYFCVECGNVLGLGGALYSALIGVSSLSKEESEHTADFLLTHPISRIRIASEKLVAAVLQVIVLNAVVIAVTLASCAIVGENPDIKPLLLIFLSYLIMQLQILAVSFGISAFMGKKSIGIGLGTAIIFYFLNIISNLTDDARFLKYLTPFSYADGAYIMENQSIEARYLTVGVIIALVCIALGMVRYSKKDMA